MEREIFLAAIAGLSAGHRSADPNWIADRAAAIAIAAARKADHVFETAFNERQKKRQAEEDQQKAEDDRQKRLQAEFDRLTAQKRQAEEDRALEEATRPDSGSDPDPEG